MTITTEAKAREEIRNIIKTAIRQYEQDCELNRVRRLKQVRDVGLPDHHAFNPIYTGPNVETRVEAGIINSPTLTDHMEALRWGREELVIHRLVTKCVSCSTLPPAAEEALAFVEKTKAKRRFWQFLG